jgi:hypothetical protein
MPATDIEHFESWSVSVTRDPGDPWPDITTLRGRRMRPDLILVYLQARAFPVVTVSGRLYRQDGSQGRARVNAPWDSLAELPAWAGDLTSAALREHGLHGTWPGDTVPGLCAAGNHRLCLIPDPDTGCPGWLPPGIPAQGGNR